MDWEIATAQIPNESRRSWISRVSSILGYAWNGEQDGRYRTALKHIYDFRENESELEYKKRVAVWFSGVFPLVSWLPYRVPEHPAEFLDSVCILPILMD